ncbi:hypothetical protein [Bradyrhizobium sp. RDI18]|uniref:hypothetical protein n=1 Tax=Bradyrhizobium TaxID=374 RepID=UPI0018D219F8
MNGGSGNDHQYAGTGAQSLRGGAGDHFLTNATSAQSTLSGGPNGDVLDRGAGDDKFWLLLVRRAQLRRCSAEAETILGNDTIIGGRGQRYCGI